MDPPSAKTKGTMRVRTTGSDDHGTVVWRHRDERSSAWHILLQTDMGIRYHERDA